MKEDHALIDCKYWNDQHSLLRRQLEGAQDFSKTIELFISHHGMVHTAKLGGYGSFQDEVLQGLSDKQMRHIPVGRANSVAWMLWHITRIEDVTMNVLLADTPQVFHQGDWQNKINSPYVDVGNEMTAKEIHALSDAVNVKALLSYRLAVGRRTRQIAGKLKADILKEKPSSECLVRLLEDGTVRERAQWLLKYWGGHPQKNLLLMPATRHSFVHLNEIGRMLPAVRRLS
jgi:hypothetical protein